MTRATTVDYQLHKAILANDLESVREALAAGADPTSIDAGGRTSLHLAASSTASETIIERLLNAGASPDAVDRNFDTPLHLACRNPGPSFSLISLLATESAMNAVNRYGQTPLDGSTHSGRKNLVKWMKSAQDSQHTR